jgi:hypothetical protein
MTGQQLPEQQAFTYDDEEGRIPRRRSATDEELHERRRAAQGQVTHTTSVPATHQWQAADGGIDDEILEEGHNPYRLPNSCRRYHAFPTPRQRTYEIPLTDGTVIRVTARELSTMPQEYKDAAQLVTPAPALAAPKPRRQPDPGRPVQDDSVIEVGPARARGTDDLARQRRRRLPRFHWLLWVGVAMLMMIFGWLAISALGNWWQEVQDYWHYGMPRTYQTDENVGHGTASDPYSHFIAQNLDKHIIVIEIPGDDPSKSRIYIGPTLIGPGQELTPVTLSFEDVNGDGKKDLVIHVEESRFIFLNDGKQFKPAPNQ